MNVFSFSLKNIEHQVVFLILGSVPALCSFPSGSTASYGIVFYPKRSNQHWPWSAAFLSWTAARCSPPCQEAVLPATSGSGSRFDFLWIPLISSWFYLMQNDNYLFLSQVSFLNSHSSLSICPWADPLLSLLQVLLCQLLASLDLHYRRRHRPREACPPCPAPGCHQQPSCRLPLYPHTSCQLAPSTEHQFPCTQGAPTTRGLYPPWPLVPTLLLDQGIHREAPELLL